MKTEEVYDISLAVKYLSKYIEKRFECNASTIFFHVLCT